MSNEYPHSVTVNVDFLGDLVCAGLLLFCLSGIGAFYFMEYGREHEAQCAVELETLRNTAAPFGSYANEDYTCPPLAVLYMRIFSLSTLY